MSAPTSPVAKRARTRGPPHRAPRLKCRSTGGRFSDVQSVVSADSDGRLLVRFTDGTQLVDADGAPRPVAKKELVFFAPQQAPDAPRQLAAPGDQPRREPDGGQARKGSARGEAAQTAVARRWTETAGGGATDHRSRVGQGVERERERALRAVVRAQCHCWPEHVDRIWSPEWAWRRYVEI